MFTYLKTRYNLKFRMSFNEEILDDLKIIRAYFKNSRNYSKIQDNTFKVSVRKSRLIKYKVFNEGKLTEKSLEPEPYLVLSFFRNDKVLNLNQS